MGLVVFSFIQKKQKIRIIYIKYRTVVTREHGILKKAPVTEVQSRKYSLVAKLLRSMILETTLGRLC